MSGALQANRQREEGLYVAALPVREFGVLHGAFFSC